MAKAKKEKDSSKEETEQQPKSDESPKVWNGPGNLLDRGIVIRPGEVIPQN